MSYFHGGTLRSVCREGRFTVVFGIWIIIICAVAIFQTILLNRAIGMVLTEIQSQNGRVTQAVLRLLLYSCGTAVLMMVKKWVTVWLEMMSQRKLQDRMWNSYKARENWFGIDGREKLNRFQTYSAAVSEKGMLVAETFFTIIVGCLSAAIYLLSENRAVALICVLGAVLELGIYTALFGKLLLGLSEAWNQRVSKASGIYQATWEHANNAEVTPFLNLSRINKQYFAQNEEYIKALRHHKWKNRASISLGQFLNVAALLVVGMGCVSFYARGEIMLPQIYVFLLVFRKLQTALMGVPQLKVLGTEFAASLKVLEEETQYPEKQGSQVVGMERVSITFQNFTVAYGEKILLSDINLQLEGGRMIGLSGASGCGKSSLLKAMLGLADMGEGISVNGIPVRSLDKTAFRLQVTMVEKTPVFFRGTVQENMACGGSYSQEQIQEICQVCGISETLYRARSVTELSSGEKQKIAVARTLLRSTPLLIFDEAFSNIDTASTERILTYLSDLSREKGYLVLVVSHEKAVLDKMHQIIYFKDRQAILQERNRTVVQEQA